MKRLIKSVQIHSPLYCLKEYFFQFRFALSMTQSCHLSRQHKSMALFWCHCRSSGHFVSIVSCTRLYLLGNKWRWEWHWHWFILCSLQHRVSVKICNVIFVKPINVNDIEYPDRRPFKKTKWKIMWRCMLLLISFYGNQSILTIINKILIKTRPFVDLLKGFHMCRVN